ncbi:MAG: Aldose 1-epimerase [Paenibacillus sp.]|jgi:galactose mutarotase-like enzyme|nr:Aldose 1-epimerase [Paenibacillus sp.]
MVLLQNDYICAKIHNLGAELHSLTLADDSGSEVIWQGDPNYWEQRAPVLFPIVGSLKNGVYSYEGQSYALPIHGFACEQRFRLIRQTAASASFELTHSTATLALYPFRFQLRIDYQLENRTLHCGYSVLNADEKALYFSLGAHPGFRLHRPQEAIIRLL